MLRFFYISFARLFMTLRECVVQDRSQEISEQAVADLNVCLDQLVARCRLIETKIEQCTRQAKQIADSAAKESPAYRVRSMGQVRQCLVDRRQQRAEYDRAYKSVSMLRNQINTILNSHVDTAIITAMRQYSNAAARLGLPDKTNEVQRLTGELSECLEQSNCLQDALGEVSDTFSLAARPATMSTDDEDADLQAELDDFFSSDATPPEAAPAAATPHAPTPRAAATPHAQTPRAAATPHAPTPAAVALEEAGGLRQRISQPPPPLVIPRLLDAAPVVEVCDGLCI